MQSIEEALAALGVNDRTLSDNEKKSLDEKGYVIFERVIRPAHLADLRASFERLMKLEGKSAGLEVHREEGTRRLSDLVNKGACYDPVYINPRVLAAVHHFLKRDFKLSSLNARDAEPGKGFQKLHTDWDDSSRPDHFHVVNSLWMIDDFSPDNGPTRVVPGTHKLLRGPDADSHPEEVLVTGEAGTVAVFNSHLWHGGTQNKSVRKRRGVHCYYTARENPQQLDQKKYIKPDTLARISPAARYILDV